MATRGLNQMGNLRGQKLRNVADPTEDLDGVNLRYFGEGENRTSFEADGTMVASGDATTWNDLQFSISSGRVSAVNFPTWSTLIGNLSEYTFAVNDYIDLGAQEVPHTYKEGTDMTIHIHWISNGTNVDNRGVKWEIEYAVRDAEASPIGNVWTGTTVVSAETIIPANTTSKTNFFTQIGTIAGTGVVIGSQVKMRLRRIASSATAPTSNPYALQLGVHFESDTLGSRTISSK